MQIENGFQSELLNIGNYGCAFLCACKAMNVEIEDIPYYFTKAKELNIIDRECTVNNWDKLLNLLEHYGKKWSVEIAEVPKPCDILIGMYFNPKTRYTHFVLLDNKSHKIIYDGLKNSLTVKNGYIKNYRICTIKC